MMSQPHTGATADSPRIAVKVAGSHDDMIKCMNVRAIVFIGEQGSPYDEEFDGNDFTATHILATVGGEPAGAMRIRYFGDFAKPERLAVLQRFRSQRFKERGVAFALAGFAFNFCARKGITRFYGHAQKRLVPFWSRFGIFKPMENGEFYFSDHEYVAMAGQVAPPPNALGLKSDHLMLIRPEGDWDRPGIYDRSQERPPTNPVGRAA